MAGSPLRNVIGALIKVTKVTGPGGSKPVGRLEKGASWKFGTDTNTLPTPINMTGVAATTITGLNNVAHQEKPSSGAVKKKDDKSHSGAGGGGDSGGGNNTPTAFTASNVKFNLPPHTWSLPINQNSLSSNIGSAGTTEHSTRRARMWCYGYTDLAAVDSTVSSTTKSRGSFASESVISSPIDTAWGFQFLWNPDAIGNALSRNANFTPSATDKTAQYYGLFTAMESVSFKIVIDRVNDFAAIRGMSRGVASETMVDLNWQTLVNQYYSGNGFPSTPDNPENPVDQLKTLMKLGTMADIEYIYKMINGEGTGGVVRTNALGRKTADIGFLSPTVIAVQFGPSTNSLSYVGYIDGLNISHTMFTEDMIPIHSEVTVNFVAFARTTLSQG